MNDRQRGGNARFTKLKINQNQNGKEKKPSYLVKKEPASRRSPEKHLEVNGQHLGDFQRMSEFSNFLQECCK